MAQTEEDVDRQIERLAVYINALLDAGHSPPQVVSQVIEKWGLAQDTATKFVNDVTNWRAAQAAAYRQTESLPDYYEILQVSPHADAEVIQAAYRRLCLKYHPDRCTEANANEMMKLLNEAYEVLSDAAKRNAYDTTRNKFKSEDNASGQGNSAGVGKSGDAEFRKSKNDKCRGEDGGKPSDFHSTTQWFLFKEGKRLGPHTIEDLYRFARAKTLLPDDLLIPSELPNPMAAKYVANIFPGLPLSFEWATARFSGNVLRPEDEYGHKVWLTRTERECCLTMQACKIGRRMGLLIGAPVFVILLLIQAI